MQLYNFSYTNKHSLQEYIQTHKINKSPNLLVQVFSGIIDIKCIKEITQTLSTLLPNANIIGSTTSGEIQNGMMQEGSITISFSLFNKTTIRSHLYHFDDINILQKIQKELLAKDTKALIIFSDGLKSNTELFVKELHTISPNIIIAGGRAGDNAEFKNTYIFDNKGYSDNGCVIATLSSKELIVNNDYLLNWTAIGKEMHVTKCQGNVLYELDGIPIIEVYRKYLGEDVVKNLPSSCMSFPLLTKKGSIEVARDPIALVNDIALAYAGDFEEGDILRFSFANIGDLTDNLDKYFRDLSQYPSEAVYVYSCTARKALLGEKLQEELNLLESLAPSVGFFTYGEFFQSNKMTELLNVTTTFMVLSESPISSKKTLKSIDTGACDPVKKALTNLVKVTTKELEHISTHDVLTSLYNRTEYIKTIEKKIKSAKRYNEFFGLILLDIDHFKLVNDNYGHNLGDKVLKTLAKTLQEHIREDDFVGRWGGEEFIIIANHIDIKELEKLTKNLQKQIAKISVKPITQLTVSFGLTIYIEGDTDESIFKRVDNALYTAKEDGRNRYVIG